MRPGPESSEESSPEKSSRGPGSALGLPGVWADARTLPSAPELTALPGEAPTLRNPLRSEAAEGISLRPKAVLR